MFRNIILFCFIFVSNHTWPSEMSIVFACSIYNIEGTLLRNYGGEHCVFEPNGNYLIAETNGSLSYRNKSNELIWRIPDLWAHHGINKSKNNYFLVISSEYDYSFKPPIRFDVFYKISHSDGKILAKYSILENFNEFSGGKKLSENYLWPLEWTTSSTGAKKEATHANSFHEILLKNEKSFFFNDGDFIVNVQGKIPRILILDKDTLKLKYSFLPPDYFTHDVQVISKDQIIYFNNTPGSKKISRENIVQLRNKSNEKSRIEIFNLAKGKKSIKNYFEKNEPLFFMPIGGSIQILDDQSVLTVDNSNNSFRILQITKNGQIVKTIDMKNSGKLGITYAKMTDLNSFLKNNIGL